MTFGEIVLYLFAIIGFFTTVIWAGSWVARKLFGPISGVRR